MGEAYFYHLTRTPMEATLPSLLTRALGAGWRVAVRGASAERMAWLDDKLWLGPEAEFLPHGVEGGPHDALQPVLLTLGRAANDPDCLMTVEGAAVTPDEVRSLARVCVLFDGTSEAAVQHARGQWRDLTAAGCGAKYWSEEDGRWQMKAETAEKPAG